jgi:predicted neutral ceramidase superfamily lipid hydrolase
MYVPLAVFLYTAGMTGGERMGVAQQVFNGGVAWTLIFQFRLWDDLMDLVQDKREHPDRVLCRANSLRPFSLLTALLCVANLMALGAVDWIANDWRRSVLFAGLNVAMFLWYRWRDKTGLSTVGRSHIALMKYPVFVYLLSGLVTPGGMIPLLLAATLVYLCFSVFELLHNSSLLASQTGERVLAVEMMGFGTALVALVYPSVPRSGLVVLVQSFLAGAGIVALVFLFRRRHTLSLGQSRQVFFIAFLSLLGVVLGGIP